MPVTESIQDKELGLSEIKIFTAFFRKEFNYDFTNYAISSLKRRLARLLTVLRIASLEQLQFVLKSTPGLSETVAREVTVNTTEMFRDPSLWKKLKMEILPALFKSTGSKLKIWHAACSSGEEVYSMCILLEEMGRLNDAAITATDLNESVLSTAKKGIYPKRAFEINDANYHRLAEQTQSGLNKYYSTFDDNCFQMNPDLIRNVTFKKFDLTNPAKFSKYDLILCRNVMIYFNFELQEHVVKLLDESLFTGGCLIIGSKETLGWCKSADNLKLTDQENKVYCKR